MECKNHPTVEAVERCAGCAEAFCANCLLELQGQTYCGACKVMVVQGQPMVNEEVLVPCKEANEAIVYACLGMSWPCLSIIFGPIAITKANQSRKRMAEDPRLSGSGKATAAMILAIASIIIFAIAMIGRMSQVGRQLH